MCSRFPSRRWTPLTTLLTALALVLGGSAQAQVANNCSNYANSAKGAYCLNGSDTWFDVMTDAIKAKVAEDKAAGCATGSAGCTAPHILQPAGDPAPGESILFYNGTGSGNAANSMKFGAPAGGGALPLNGGQPALGTQSIGPMSRNFRPNESCAGSGNPNCGTQQLGQFPSWQPQIPNVGGLDAATIITKAQGNRFTNFTLPLLPTDSTKANPNTTSLGCTFGNPGGPVGGVAGTGNCYDELLQIILSGVDGSGTAAACADPKRVQAIADFSAAFGSTLRHFYRRDDNSGTTDTFKDKINVGRFCNGAAVGVLGTNKAHPNLNNEDHDPIRRPCDVSIAGVREAVSCTDLTGATPVACTTNSTNCTQGFLTALSENDTGISDITVTIATRAGTDTSGLTVGYAGREGIRLPAGNTAGPFINTNPPTNALVRQDIYLLARRLFIQRGPSLPSLDGTVTTGSNVRTNAVGGACASPPCTERVNDLGGPNAALKCPDGDTNSCTGGGTKQRTAEDALFLWMTDTGGAGSQQGAPGRFNLDPIMTARGFLACTDDSSPPSGAGNLCSKTPFPVIPSPPSACTPTTSGGPVPWKFDQVACTGTAICCSNGLACNAQPAGTPASTCAAATSRPVNSACSANGVQAECGAGLVCTDIGGGLLTCQ
jgi:hypothetical protein